jgi:ERCC4-type nuclease
LKIKTDSREQRPLDFPESEVVTMPYGDYGGCWDCGAGMPIVFERKGFSDLWTTLGNGEGHERFKRELERAKADKVKLVLVVEATMNEVYAGHPRAKMLGTTMMKKLFTFWVKYDLQVMFFNNRSDMKRYIIETFEAIERNYQPKTEVRL